VTSYGDEHPEVFEPVESGRDEIELADDRAGRATERLRDSRRWEIRRELRREHPDATHDEIMEMMSERPEYRSLSEVTRRRRHLREAGDSAGLEQMAAEIRPGVTLADDVRQRILAKWPESPRAARAIGAEHFGSWPKAVRALFDGPDDFERQIERARSRDRADMPAPLEMDVEALAQEVADAGLSRREVRRRLRELVREHDPGLMRRIGSIHDVLWQEVSERRRTRSRSAVIGGRE
jgi:hypothetical protein